MVNSRGFFSARISSAVLMYEFVCGFEYSSWAMCTQLVYQ